MVVVKNKLRNKLYNSRSSSGFSILRCQPVRLGYNLTDSRRDFSLPRKVGGQSEVPYKHVGTSSSSTISRPSCSSVKVKDIKPFPRQHDSSLSIKKEGISSINAEAGNIPGNSENNPKGRYLSQPQIYSGKNQCLSGLPQQIHSIPSDGTSNFSRDIKLDPRKTELKDPNRSICFSSDSKMSSVLLSNPRSEVNGNRCSSTRLDEIQDTVCLSTSSLNPKGALQVGQDAGRPSPHIDSPCMEDQVLVPSGSSEISKNIPTTSSESRLISNKPISEFSCKSFKISFDRTSFIKTILISGDPELDNMLSTCLRSTTIKNYSYCWKMFYDFCLSKNKINEVNFDLVLSYFKYLILTKKFIYTTIKCHRSALADPLKLIFNEDIFENIKFQLLFKYSRTNSLKVDNFFPMWDLDKVMGFIISENFKHLAASDNSWYIKKFLFLVAIAASRRISEFHALSLNESKFNDDGSVQLNPHKKFFCQKSFI